MEINFINDLFIHWQSKLEVFSGLQDLFGGDIKFRVRGNMPQTWVIQCGTSRVIANEDLDADCTIELEEEDLLRWANKTSNPQSLYNLGKIVVRGNTELALNLFKLID